MKKAIITIVVVVMTVVVGGATAWLIGSRSTPPNPTAGVQFVDKTDAKAVDVTIRDLSFSPPAIQVKKGTTVTWTNQDSAPHSVIADDSPDTGGIPATHELFGHGQTESVTFVRVGTFAYHCGAHAFMKGTIEVVN